MDVIAQDQLNAKLKYYFEGYVVNKAISNRQDIRRVPKFVAEHLITSVADVNDPREFNERLSRIVEMLNTLYPEPKERDAILDKVIVKKEQHALIDELKVVVDEKHSIRKAILPSLNLKNVMVTDSVVEANRQLLSTGIWGLVKLRYADPVVDSKGRLVTLPVVVYDFKPFHVSDVDLQEFIAKRQYFSLEEWISVLVNTIGLNPSVYTEEQKLLLLSRLVPLVENNVNMMEFGPRATGKTYIYRNVSFHTRIISGGIVTPAQLFYNISRRTVGEIGMKDCVVFDEVAKIRFPNPDEMMGKLKDYMESGNFERGPKRGAALCSLVFMGNINVSGDVPAEDVNYALPEFMRNDTAFLDRIHGIIPGWKLPKIKRSDIHLSSNYGFSTDYFSEVLHELRKLDFATWLRSKVQLENVTIRDEKAIYRIASGLGKILYPNRELLDSEGLKLIFDLAIDLRQRVANLLHRIAPGEFEKKRMYYEIID